MSSEKAEKQKYTVVYSDKEFEIRFYTAATLATVQSDAKTYKELSGPGFRKLAGYIFGGNVSDTQISMTAPVQMDINDSLSEMNFVMPSGYTIDNLPKPKDSKVILHVSAEENVAVIRFSGFATDKEIRNYSEKLKELLNEIIVSVKWQKWLFAIHNRSFSIA